VGESVIVEKVYRSCLVKEVYSVRLLSAALG